MNHIIFSRVGIPLQVKHWHFSWIIRAGHQNKLSFKMFPARKNHSYLITETEKAKAQFEGNQHFPWQTATRQQMKAISSKTICRTLYFILVKATLSGGTCLKIIFCSTIIFSNSLCLHFLNAVCAQECLAFICLSVSV